MATVEISNVFGFGAAPGRLHDARLDFPTPGTTEDVYGFDIQGWALASGPLVEAVEVLDQGRPLAELPVGDARPDVDAAFADVAVEAQGFHGSIGALSLHRNFEVLVRFRFSDGKRLPLARIQGHRAPLPSTRAASIQPLIVNTIGRSGSTWLTWLLGCHPEIVALDPFGRDVRTATYWMSVLQSLAEPSSYLSQFDPDRLEDRHWWIGRGSRDHASLGDPRLAKWLGGLGVEGIADACASRIDAFYRWVHGHDGSPSFFVEKFSPYQVQAELLWEAYPGGRELILVRDFRDMLSSIRAFNAKRGYPAFGAEKAADELDYISSVIEPSARALLARLRQREEHVHLVRYEDLTLRPAETLSDVLRYVGVDATAKTVEETLHRATEHASGTEGHRTVTDPARSVGRWRRDLPADLAEACNRVLAEVLAEFGYPADASMADAAGAGDDRPTGRGIAAAARGTAGG